MSRVFTFAVTVREHDDYTANESEDDIHAALRDSGTEVVEIHLTAIRTDVD